MRTTVTLDDDLFMEAKLLAVRRRTTLTALIERGLRDVVERETAPPVTPIELPTWSGGQPLNGIDIADTSSLFAMMDDEDAARRR